MEWLLAFLTSLSADPGVLEHERPKAAAAVAFAYAGMADGVLPAPPAPTPPAPPAPGKAAAPCPTGNCPPKGTSK
jgi:hypothetical protein